MELARFNPIWKMVIRPGGPTLLSVKFSRGTWFDQNYEERD